MSAYMFGVSRRKITKAVERKADKIAARHGCALVSATIPGTGYQRWFSGPSLGHPFDAAMARAVYADLAAAGLAEHFPG